ncbi:MAG: NAD(+) diphosphatase [Pseudomonadota bacterium]
MRHAESVTFGGSGLDRVGELRADSAGLAAAQADPKARAIALWRGKPLIDRARPAHLLRLPMDHPVFAHAAEAPLFLGREDGAPCFAFDVSPWDPPGPEDGSLGQFLDPSEQQFPGMGETQVFAELRRIMTWLSARDAELAASARALVEWHRIHPYCARCGSKSVLAQGGWQRTCPSCGASHFPRTDPVVIMLITQGNSVLMGRSPHFPQGMYSLLAGFVEPGETIEAAVRREVFEEAGVRVGAVTYLASQPWPFPASLMIGCAGAATSQEITIDPAEIEDARWISREEMVDISAGTHPTILSARKGAIAHFLIENWLADSLE